MISVIIPLYNKETIISRTLASVLSQDYDDYEIVIVNDGSTDRSCDIVRGIKDSHIVLVEQSNGGPSKARNTALKYAKGEWVLFLDADDELKSGALAYLDRVVNNHNDIDIIIGCAILRKGKEEVYCTDYKDGYCKNAFKQIAVDRLKPYTGSVLYKKSLCVNYPFNESLRRYEDYECFFRKAHNSVVYTISLPILYINMDYNEASKGRDDINEDFVGHLCFSNKSFWEKMALYKLYIFERPLYPKQINSLYPYLRYRYDLLLLRKLLCKLYSK